MFKQQRVTKSTAGSGQRIFHTARLILLVALSLSATGCISTVVGAVVDTTIAVVKVPFKVAGAVIDVVTPDDSDDLVDSLNDKQSQAKPDINSEEAALDMEYRPL